MRFTDLLRVLGQPSSATVLALVTSGVLALSCAQGVGGTTGTPISTNPTEDDDDSATGDNGDDDNVNPDSGAFGQQDGGADSGDDDDDAPGREAGPEAGPTDAGDAGDASNVDASDAATDGGGSTAPVCPEMTSGTLTIVEVMIASKSGTDEGEWIELLNPSSTCAVELTGFTVTSPRGTLTDTATLNDGYRVGPGETVVVADSLAAANNNGLTGQIYAWNADDVLANGGDSVSVLHDTTVLNTFTYTSANAPTDGRSLEYPSDCALKNVGTLGYWAPASTSYGTIAGCGTAGTAACMGTPNASNLDVSPSQGCE